MLVTHETNMGQMDFTAARRVKRLTLLLLAHVAQAGLALGADFSVTPISDSKLISREPVISETGLAAWSSYTEPKAENPSSDIYIYTPGRKPHAITAAKSQGDANFRPQVQSNTVVWVGPSPGSVLRPDWVLREVPDSSRDTPFPEIRAMYVAREDGTGHKWYEEVQTNTPPTDVTASTAPSTTNTSVSTNEQIHMPTNTSTGEDFKMLEPPSDRSLDPNLARRTPSGATEIYMWDGRAEIQRITRDNRDDLAPSVWGSLITWQKAKGWPFGWEIMVWDKGARSQLTTNFYYDMAPKAQGNQVAWYGWDGHDFEIYLYDNTTHTTTQITSNQYDDVSPALWDGVVVWEGYPGVDADIFMWKDGKTQKLSDNLEDDLNPRIWNGQVVWQGFDGDDFEIYSFDGEKAVKLTSNTYDDVNPDIQDGLVCWMSYVDNWDSEICVWDGKEIKQLTDNDFEDRDPKTAAGRVIWQEDQGDKSIIYLAEPKK